MTVSQKRIARARRQAELGSEQNRQYSNWKLPKGVDMEKKSTLATTEQALRM